MGVILYRVQSALDGRGPWRPGFSNNWVDDSRTPADYRRLAPWTEQFGRGILRKQKQGEAAGCACTSLEQLKLWFTAKEYSTLLKFGYHAVRFDDGRILAHSATQCVFARPAPLVLNVVPFALY